MKTVYYAYIPVFAVIGAYFLLQHREKPDFSVTVVPATVAKTLSLNPRDTSSRSEPLSSVSESASGRTPSSARHAKDIETFLANSGTVKSLVARDLKQLVDAAAALEIPDGKVLHQKGEPGQEYAYREMRTDWGAEIKKISKNNQMISETYSSPTREQFLRREFNPDGQLRTLALRWSGREGVMVDFYGNGQISNISEAVNGETTSQKWDKDGQLVEHNSVRVIDGQYQKIDHIKNTVSHPMDESDAGADE